MTKNLQLRINVLTFFRYQSVKANTHTQKFLLEQRRKKLVKVCGKMICLTKPDRSFNQLIGSLHSNKIAFNSIHLEKKEGKRP